MENIDNYQRAFDIGQECLQQIDKLNTQEYSDNLAKFSNEYPIIIPPPQIQSSKWSMTVQSLEHTLHYIFDKLSHQCYMLCLVDGQAKMYKLIIRENSHLFEGDVKKRAITKMRANKLITSAQQGEIMALVSKPVRIMQCIVKPVVGEKDVENEYLTLLRRILAQNPHSLPNGLFILNLTDAIILRENGHEPFPMVTGDHPLGQFDFPSQLPILSMSGQRGYLDIPMPNYDDIFVALGTVQIPMDKFVKRWSKKTIDRAVFRGGPSGCGYTADTNMRIKLVTMALSKDPRAADLDVAITGKGATIDSHSIRFDPVHGLGMLNTGIKPASKFMTMVEQSNYKYIIHVDGNVNAYRLLTTMATGSLILRVESEYTSWVDHMISPNVHYLPIRADLSNLFEQIAWAKANDSKCKKMALKSLEFAQMALTREFIENSLQKILWSVANKVNRVKTPSPTPPKAKTPTPPKDKTLTPKAKTPTPPKDKTPTPPKDKTPTPSPNKELSPSKSSKKRCPKGSRKNKAGKCIDNITGLEVPMEMSPKAKTGTRKNKGSSNSASPSSPSSLKLKLSKAEIKKCHDEIKKHLL